MENQKREGEQECGKNIDGICFIMSHSIVVTRKKMIAYNWLDGPISKAVTLKINCSFPIFSIMAISKASIFGISLCRHRWSCANARCELFSNLWLYHWVRGDSLLRLLVFHLFCVYPVSRLLTSMHQMGVTADFSTNISDLVVQTQFFWRFCCLYPVLFSHDHLSKSQRFYK